MPFTRATTASDADEDELAEEEEFFEQPNAAGSTNSASAAMVATVRARGRAGSVDGERVKSFGEIDLSNVMAAVPGKCAGPPDWRRRTVAQSLSLCNGSIRPDSDDSVSGGWPIDKDVTPSYLSAKPTLRQEPAFT